MSAAQVKTFPRREAVVAAAANIDEMGNALEYHLSIPDDAMYGELKRLVSLTQSPLSYAYPIAIALQAGRGINMSDENPRSRPTAYTLLVGPVGAGKSSATNRVRETMGIGKKDIRCTVPGSERGLIKIFKDTNEMKIPVPACLVVDEMKGVLKKMRILGSTLEQAFCELWSNDSFSVADKKGSDSMYARMSLVGNVAIENQAEFTTVFGAESAGGFSDRAIYAPPAPDWEYDLLWKAPKHDDGSVTLDGETFAPTMARAPRPKGVTMPDARLAQVMAWARRKKDLGVRPGRLTEIAIRVAVITASANGDPEVTEEAMAAALRFAEWQMKVRAFYVPGASENEGGRVTTLIMNAMEAVTKEWKEKRYRPRPGENPLIDNHGWIRPYLLTRKHSWHTTYGADKISTALRSLVHLGLLEQDIDPVTEKPRNLYRVA